MASKTFLTVSFSGAGHLLPYHLGAASVLLSSHRKIPPIRAVSGSSSGAIAAVLLSRLPHRLHDYTETFIETRGKAMELLQRFLYQEEVVDPHQKPQVVVMRKNKDDDDKNGPPTLHIATTKCQDGSLHLFDFEPPKPLFHSISNSNQHDHLLRCVRASCAIPSSFHPVDVLKKSTNVSYPNDDGLEINGDYHVDGGIAGPAPPTRLDNHKDACRVVVSPISAGSIASSLNSSSSRYYRISPVDKSFAIWNTISCKGDFTVRPSIQNLKALVASAGSVSSPLLREWYERGVEDAERLVENWEPN